MAWIVIRTDADEELVSVEMQPPAGDWPERVTIDDPGVAETLAHIAMTKELPTLTAAIGDAFRKDAKSRN